MAGKGKIMAGRARNFIALTGKLPDKAGIFND